MMGISVAASAKNSGCEVYWTSSGRSALTRERAEGHALIDAGSLVALAQTCQVIVSVCPPSAAEEVAYEVLSNGYTGLYVDANAIAPERSVRMGRKLEAGGVQYIDGGIIGGPAWQPGSTWLYLSGPEAGRAAACFSDGPLETDVISEEIGQASALKMCYAAWTKGTTALLCAILGAAESYEVWGDLEAQWERDRPGFAEDAVRRARRVTAKAWRFEGEMHEIAATFRDAGLPGDFHTGAAEIYRRLAPLQHLAGEPTLADVLDRIIQGHSPERPA